MRETLRAHGARYPAMEAQDAAKLLYQSVFGGGHMADDPAGRMERLRKEAAGGDRGAIVALDGRCGAGKTTMAQRLRAQFGWQVIPMDHFFLRPEQRTRSRYERPGENVDHERFLEEVLLPLQGGRPFTYRPFDCHTGEMARPVAVEPGGVVIVEGSYCCHRDLWSHYDLRAFLTVEPEEQRRRLMDREGASRARVFQERWIPLEEAYFAAEKLEERCDYVLELGWEQVGA